MTEPASGSVAATTAIATSSGGLFALSSLMPASASFYEFAWGCLFAIFGAFCYQFIEAQVQRQIAADRNVPVADRPRIDITMLGYSMCGAPLATACVIYGIHLFGGATGFGSPAWLQSVAGFMVAGAAGPKIVTKFVGAIVGLVGSWLGARTP